MFLYDLDDVTLRRILVTIYELYWYRYEVKSDGNRYTSKSTID